MHLTKVQPFACFLFHPRVNCTAEKKTKCDSKLSRNEQTTKIDYLQIHSPGFPRLFWILVWSVNEALFTSADQLSTPTSDRFLLIPRRSTKAREPWKEKIEWLKDATWPIRQVCVASTRHARHDLRGEDSSCVIHALAWPVFPIKGLWRYFEQWKKK
jgi:hypothetical protein